jgi:two-component system, response regulator
MAANEIEILLIEDNPSDVELTLHALRHNKLANQIHVACDGEEALDFIFCRGKFSKHSFNSPPKLILLDLYLPKVDGLEVLRAIKSDPRTKHIPVVILTSSREDQHRIDSYNLGVNSYIQKPVDFDQFRATIEQLSLYWIVVNQPPTIQAYQT